MLHRSKVIFYVYNRVESLYNAHVGAESQYKVSFTTTQAISHCSWLDAKIRYMFRLQRVLWLLSECSMDTVLGKLHIEKATLESCLCLAHKSCDT